MNKQQLASAWGLAGFVMVATQEPVQADVNKVTAVEVIPTANGIEIVVKTTDNKPLQVFTSSYGKTFVANVLNTQLQLADNKFRQVNPTEGIASVSVTQQGANSIRVIVTGTSSLPTAKVEKSDASGGLRQRSLVLSLTSAADTTATQPTPTPQVPPAAQPQSQTPPEQTEPLEDDLTQESVEPEQPDETPEGDEEIEVVVTGEQEQTGYSAPNATTATRTDTPIRDIPQSIQVVPRQVLEDRQVIRVGDALQNVSGVNNQGSYSGIADRITIRGFLADRFQGNYFRDGIRNYSNFSFLETANLEQIEVLKGPASVLFGQAQPGGIINLVTKQPLNEPYFAPRVTIGNYDTYQGLLDLSGPLNESKTVSYRLNAYYENAESFRDFVESERLFIAPVLRWEISPNTSLTVDAEFTDDSRTMDDGIVAIGDRPADIPISRFLNEPFSNFARQEYSVGYVFNHRFNDNLSVRNAFRVQWNYPERYYPLADSLDENTGELTRSAYWAGGEYSSFFTQTEGIGKFATGSIKHQLLFGFEYGKTTENSNFRTDIFYPSINIFNPVYVRERYPKDPNFFRDDTTKTL